MQRDYIKHTINTNNILPLLSHCNTRCLFCSHLGNPSDIKVLSIGMRSFKEIMDDIQFLNPEHDIIIGESATPIIEGEPFLHPQILEIIKSIRQSFPTTTVRITTNGTLLTEELIKEIFSYGNIEFNISLNALTSENHKLLMGNIISQQALEKGFWLEKYNIPWHGSIVAMPWLTGWEELKVSLEYFHKHGASTARVFIPGFTSLSPQEVHFAPDFPQQLKYFISKLRTEIPIPISLEPPMLNNLLPEIAGIIPDSPAEKAGIKPCDIVIAVNNKKVASRVDAWVTIKNSSNPVVTLKRNDINLQVTVVKKSQESSGLVCDYDFDWKRAKKLRKYKKLILMLASELAFPVVKEFPRLLSMDNLQVESVKNRTFDGSIACAGLLCVQDIKAYLNMQDSYPPTILLPAEMFDYQGYDLMGVNYRDIQEQYRVQVKIL